MINSLIEGIMLLVNAILSLWMVHALLFFIASFIPEKKVFLRHVYKIFWITGYWGILLSSLMQTEFGARLAAAFSILFFQTATIFFFSTSFFPLKRIFLGYLYSVFFTAWPIAFIAYPKYITPPVSTVGFLIFLICFCSMRHVCSQCTNVDENIEEPNSK